MGMQLAVRGSLASARCMAARKAPSKPDCAKHQCSRPAS